MFQERRRSTRAAYHAGVKWKDLTDPSKLMGVIPDDSKNISVGGMRMTSSIGLKVGEELQLEFALPGHQLMDIKGEVKWVARIGGDDGTSATYNVGIELLDIEDKDKDFIDKFVFTTKTT